MEQDKKTEYIIYGILIAFTLVVYITGLFPGGIVDSAKYAAISRHILESGDLIHLKIHGEPYMHKPPLLFWMSAASYSILGLSMFAFKLPNLLYSFLGIYSVYRLGKLIYGKNTGIIAAVMYSVSEAVILMQADVHTDLLLTTNIIFGVWQLAEYLENKKIWNYLLGFTGVGLAMISKGALGLAIPVFAIGGYLMFRKDFKTLFSVKWLAGIPVLLIIIYPALKGVYDQFGIEGLKFYFWSNNIDRIKGDYSQGRHDYFFVIHTLIYFFLPWSLYSFAAFVKDFRVWKNSGYKFENKKDALNYSGIIFLAVIISVSSQQAPHYLLPFIPFLSILTARFINELAITDDYPLTYKWVLYLRTFIVIILSVISLVLITYFFPTSNLLIWIPVLFLFILLIYSYRFLKSKIQKLILPLVISMLITGFVTNTVYMPEIPIYHGYVQASLLFNKLASDDAKLFTYDYYLQYETYFYPKTVSGIVYPNELKKVLSDGSCWFITSEKGYREIEAVKKSSLTEIHEFPHKRVTNITLDFLNPATRDKKVSKVYLLQIQ
jgi:4-amino-4-deoxy-L-arabinose transferase-like glycosyltransferase